MGNLVALKRITWFSVWQHINIWVYFIWFFYLFFWKQLHSFNGCESLNVFLFCIWVYQWICLCVRVCMWFVCFAIQKSGQINMNFKYCASKTHLRPIKFYNRTNERWIHCIFHHFIVCMNSVSSFFSSRNDHICYISYNLFSYVFKIYNRIRFYMPRFSVHNFIFVFIKKNSYIFSFLAFFLSVLTTNKSSYKVTALCLITTIRCAHLTSLTH